MYNQFYDGKSAEIRSREVNGRLILEGSLRIHWGVQGVIHLKENDDQRTVVTVRKRNSYRRSQEFDSDEDIYDISRDTSYNDISTCSSDVDVSVNSLNENENENASDTSADKTDTGIDSDSDTLDTFSSTSIETVPKSLTLPPKLNIKNMEWDELDELLQVERRVDESAKLYQTMPTPLPSQSSTESYSSTVSANESSTDDNMTTE